MLPPELGVALGHFDVGMPENLSQIVKIVAVSGSERMTQVIEPEVGDLCSPEQIVEIPIESASVAIGPLPFRTCGNRFGVEEGQPKLERRTQNHFAIQSEQPFGA